MLVAEFSRHFIPPSIHLCFAKVDYIGRLPACEFVSLCTNDFFLFLSFVDTLIQLIFLFLHLFTAFAQVQQTQFIIQFEVPIFACSKRHRNFKI